MSQKTGRLIIKSIPDNTHPYAKTALFDEKSIPPGLKKNHQTKENVWGKINVLKGELVYTIQSEPPEVIVLSPEVHGVVEPQTFHNVKANGEVKFYVEFYK